MAAESNTPAKTQTSSGKEEVLAVFQSGGVNVRRVISKSDWASVDIEMEKDTVWEKRNNWTLTATGWPVAAIKYLENDAQFKIERHKA